MDDFDFLLQDDDDRSIDLLDMMRNSTPICVANEPLGPCGPGRCDWGDGKECRTWSNPYGCGGCCACRGCLKPWFEADNAPWVWEGDYA